MGLALYDDGQVDLIGSATAFAAFGEWALGQGGELEFFGAEGYTKSLAKLETELMAAKPEDPVVEGLRERFLELLPKATEIFIVSES